MKAKVLSYAEIEEIFKELLLELERHPLDEESIVEKGGLLLFALGVCISQMRAPNSTPYPEKSKHLAILEKASASITYNINTCTLEEVRRQVSAAYRAYGANLMFEILCNLGAVRVPGSAAVKQGPRYHRCPYRCRYRGLRVSGLLHGGLRANAWTIVH